MCVKWVVHCCGMRKKEGEEEVLSEFMTSKHGTKNLLVKDLSSCSKYDKWTFEKHILCCCKVHLKKISSAAQAQCSVHLQVFKHLSLLKLDRYISDWPLNEQQQQGNGKNISINLASRMYVPLFRPCDFSYYLLIFRPYSYEEDNKGQIWGSTFLIFYIQSVLKKHHLTHRPIILIFSLLSV